MFKNKEFFACPCCGKEIIKKAIICRYCYTIIDGERFTVLGVKKNREYPDTLSINEFPEASGLDNKVEPDTVISNDRSTIEWEGGTYVGQLKDGRPHGQGQATGPEGNIYEGEWKEGKKQGKGFYVWAEPYGGKYEGEWRMGQSSGKGRLEYNDGTIYESEFKDGVPHGYGKMSTPDGFSYAGEFKEGKYHGKGTHTYSDSDYGEKYVGEFKEGYRHGQGVSYDKDENIIHEGLWLEDEFQG